ncbi:MAG: GDP-mannose 4,6-dehydratase, partial [Chloroflexi bacterium]|nr:GDP-mannose 4,6-dehydratase [Chloroflexota bacterium]
NLAQHRGDPRCQVHQVDATSLAADSELFRGARYVFHFAGLGDIVPSIEHPLEYMHANVDGTLAVLEAARHAAVCKVVYAASSSCYGASPPVPTSESAPIKPEYPYALSKYLGESAVLHWAEVYRLPCVSIRIFNAYGPRVRTTGVYGAVFGVFLAQKLKGKPLTVVGDGTQSRDFVYVTDVARAFLAAAESDECGEVFNLGAGNPQSINRLVELIGGEVTYVPKRPGEPDCTWADTRKIRERLGWEPHVNFDQGVAAMLRDIHRWEDAPVWDPTSIAAATRTWFEFMTR